MNNSLDEYERRFMVYFCAASLNQLKTKMHLPDVPGLILVLEEVLSGYQQPGDTQLFPIVQDAARQPNPNLAGVGSKLGQV